MFRKHVCQVSVFTQRRREHTDVLQTRSPTFVGERAPSVCGLGWRDTGAPDFSGTPVSPPDARAPGVSDRHRTMVEYETRSVGEEILSISSHRPSEFTLLQTFGDSTHRGLKGTPVRSHHWSWSFSLSVESSTLEPFSSNYLFFLNLTTTDPRPWKVVPRSST